MSAALIDYTEAVRSSTGGDRILCAQGLGRDCLILERLPEPVRRLDGGRAHYRLEYRWLSADCERADDEAYCCVRGCESSYWQRKESRPVLDAIRDGSTNLFEHFRLFP